MTRLMATFIALLLTALAFTAWRFSVANKDLGEAQRTIGTLSAGLDSRDKAIVRLNSEAREGQKREAALRLLMTRASAGALARERHIQRETDAKPELRAWSAVALPADVIRLHQRPAFASAGDYLDWLPTRDKLPVSGKRPADAGRSGGR